MCGTGFPGLLACSQVSLVPPLIGRSRLKITVPSLSSMFLLVRAGYELVESSTRSLAACWSHLGCGLDWLQ